MPSFTPAIFAAAPMLNLAYILRLGSGTNSTGGLALPDIHDLAIETPNPDTVKLSWQSTDAKSPKAKIFSSSSLDKGYKEVKEDITFDPSNTFATLVKQTGEQYYRAIPEKAKAATGGEDDEQKAGTTPSETVGRVVYTLKPGINVVKANSNQTITSLKNVIIAPNKAYQISIDKKSADITFSLLIKL